MAKIYNFYEFGHQKNDSDYNNFSMTHIQIKNDFGQQTANELEKELRNYNNIAIANNIKSPGGKGGGEEIIFPIATWIGIGLSIYIGKGFFDELGRDLAKRLLKFLFDQKSTTELMILRDGKIYTVLVPPKISANHLRRFDNEIRKLKVGGKYVYCAKSKKIIKID